MYTVSGNKMRISVRNLVEFICVSGDIDNTESGVRDVKVMQEGARLHRKIQKSMGSSYHAEVSLKHSIALRSPADIEYELIIEGRADGIIADLEEDEDGNKIPVSEVTVDEIKTVQKDVKKLKEAVYVHKAQACVYAYIYALKMKLSAINVQITYCNTETEEIVHFKQEYSFEQISAWFEDLIQKYRRWSDFVFDEKDKRQHSIEKLEFPYEYREGQKNLCISVYKSLKEKKNLFIQAPTGVGKTLSTIFPAVLSMGQDYVDKIFYLTSKTITKTVAEDTYGILRGKGLSFRTVTLTAKDKICRLDERNCNPSECEYAKGHFDRVNDAVYDLITHEYVTDREKILEYSQKYKVCPYEMSLDVSYWCDGIICDYNYVFDPDASLKRYFSEGNKGEYAFLVDEAHNLVDRARQMYSATISKEDFLMCRKIVKDVDKKLYGCLEKCNKLLLEYKRNCDTYRVMVLPGTFIMSLERCYSLMQKFLEVNKGKQPAKDCLEFFFKLRHFLNMYDCFNDKYVAYSEHDESGEFLLHLYCVDPSENISVRLNQGRAAVLFSATLLPVNYFKEMLSGDINDNAVYAHSSFRPDNKRVIIARDVTSRYTRRNTVEYRKICEYISACITAKPGKYMVFFPSYSYMDSVFAEFERMYEFKHLEIAESYDNLVHHGINVITQTNHMNEADKENFLKLFNDVGLDNETMGIVGFCVLGGVFSEGIDLKDESLIGAVIVGTGLPMLCRNRDILRNYFDEMGKDGYSYAYVYPGMNKVLQAAGRVIRTESDRGIIVLLDDRFLAKEYELMFPREWDCVYPVNLKCISECVDEFWKTVH